MSTSCDRVLVYLWCSTGEITRGDAQGGVTAPGARVGGPWGARHAGFVRSSLGGGVMTAQNPVDSKANAGPQPLNVSRRRGDRRQRGAAITPTAVRAHHFARA